MGTDRRKTLAALPTNRRMSVGGSSIGPGPDMKKIVKGKTRTRMSFMPSASTGMSFAPISEHDEHADENVDEHVDEPTKNLNRSMDRGKISGSVRKTERRRKTMMPMERSSMSVANGIHSRHDPRPVTERTFVNESVKIVYHYLIEHDYPHAITQKTVFRPSSRDFNNILTFLMRKIIPSFNNGYMKFEEEVVASFKGLGYGFPISKTGLASVGAPHTWPPILAALTWLVGLLGYEEKAKASKLQDDAEPEALDDASPLEKVFFEYLGHAYVAYMTQDTEELESLAEGLNAVFEEKIQFIYDEAERQADINMALEDEIKQMDSKAASLPESLEKLENLNTKANDYRKVIENLLAYKEDFSAKVSKKNLQLQENEKKLGEIRTIVNSLKVKISSQGLTTEDVRRMELEQVRLKEGLERSKETKKSNNDELLKHEAELSKRFGKLEEIVKNYNSKASELQFIPITAKNSGQKKLMIEIGRKDASESTTKLLGGIDLSEIKYYLDDFKRTVVTRTLENKEIFGKLLDEEEVSEIKLTEMMDNLAILTEKAKRSEETFCREKEELDAVIAAREKETIEIESKVSALRNPHAFESALINAQDKIAQLKSLREENQKENDLKKAEVQNEITKALKTVSESKEYIQKQILFLKQYILETKSSLIVLDMPKPDELGEQTKV